MIIVKLQGGLGNQMFQYALGRSLSEIHNSEFKVDISEYENQPETITLRKYALNCFNIQENFASRSDLAEFMKEKKEIKLKKFFYHLFKKEKYIFRPHNSFKKEILNIHKDVYLDGYWQTEKYFKGIESIIRGEFKLKKEFSIENLKITKQIEDCNSVSLHIRRGDYAENTIINKVHGLCGLEYYEYAIKYISEKISNPHFFIFSDDVPWVRKNLKINHFQVYVSDSNLLDSQEMMLMSRCKNNIIANSSFSWWGAWLNKNHEKIVTAPKQWFADNNVDTSDIIPETWIRL